MADYVSNAAELVENLRFSCPKHGEEICVEQQAADAIEALLAENAKMKAERDDWRQKYLSSEADATNLTGLLVQAVAELKKECYTPYGGCHLCKNLHTELCRTCIRNDMSIADSPTDKWEWRGVQKEEEDD